MLDITFPVSMQRGTGHHCSPRQGVAGGVCQILKRNPKQEERQQIQLEAQNLEKRVSKAEADREELELQILQLKKRLRSKSPPNSSEMVRNFYQQQ